MKDLMLILASIMSEDMMINQLKDAIQEYESDPTSQNFSKIGMIGMMIASKDSINKTEGGLESMMKQMDDLQKAKDFYPKDAL